MAPGGAAEAVVELAGRRADSGRVEGRRGNDDADSVFPPEMLEQARATPGGWLYVIDPAFARAGLEGVVPLEAIKGAWRIGEDGLPTGEFEPNPGYRG